LLPGPDLTGGRHGAPGGRPGPSGVFGISERDWLSNYRVLKIEGFGGRPPVGERPGARNPPPPINPALVAAAAELKYFSCFLVKLKSKIALHQPS